MSEFKKEKIELWNTQFQTQTPQQVLQFAVDTFGKSLTLASSLGVEDQVLSDMLLKIDPEARIFVLDTGRLHQETYDTMALTMARYSMKYEVYFPQPQAVEAMVTEHGPNLFYNSVDLRKHCCFVRKVEPLKRALAGVEAWITGQRKEQAITRKELPVIEWDDAHQCVKLNPLANWTTEQVWQYAEQNEVPTNYLHKQGFPSIGCAPCTRAIKPGEDLRAGRWWWENPEGKECGLHAK